MSLTLNGNKNIKILDKTYKYIYNYGYNLY